MSIDNTVDAFETVVRHLEAGNTAAAKEAARLSLQAAVEQQRRHWQYWEDRQREELAAAALVSAAHLYEEASAEEIPW